MWQCIFEKGYTSELQTNAIELEPTFPVGVLSISIVNDKQLLFFSSFFFFSLFYIILHQEEQKQNKQQKKNLKTNIAIHKKIT